MQPSQVLHWIPFLPLIGALVNLLVGRKMPRWFVDIIAIGSVLASFCLVFVTVFGFPFLRTGPLWELFQGRGEGQAVALQQTLYTWIQVGDFKVDLMFRMDTLSAVMCLVVTGVGTLIHIYSTGYMAEEPRYATYFGYLNLFTGAMLILVLGANMPLMFVGWEGVGVCSYLLIGFWYTNDDFATAGRKAFVVNRIGDAAFLLGMFLLFYATRTLDFAELGSATHAAAYKASFLGGERLAATAGILLFIGACGKSAQIPLHVWLPDAMAGPTPVSALIHAATMVTAGVYMVARMSFLYSQSTTAMAVVATVGMVTALVAAFVAFSQTDMKKVLAYSTVSQLGFMFVGVGTGNWAFAIFHVMTHAFFKAGLFLGAGSVMHAMSGSGDITTMGGLRKRLPITHLTFLIYCLAIAGFPVFFAGWYSKDAILAGTWASVHEGWPSWYGNFLWAGLTVAAFGTAVYMFRLYFLVFWGELRADEETKAHIHESPASMTIPLVILAVLSMVGGLVGIPHVLNHHYADLLPRFLEPSLAEAEGAHFHHLSDGRVRLLLGIATVVGLAGIGVAWLLWGKGPSRTVDRWVDGPLHGLHKASLRKAYFDDFYDLVIVRPFRWIANGIFQFVDRFLIDTVLVEGPARALGLFGRLARWIQNGQVQRYMVGLILGAALIFFLSGRATHPGIQWRRVPEGIELRAYAGSGLQTEKARHRWDLTGDGQWDLLPEAEERITHELSGDPSSNWHRMIVALQRAHVKVEIGHDTHDLGTWTIEEVSAYLRQLSPSRLALLIERPEIPRDAKERYADHLAAIATRPQDFVSDPVLVRRAGEVGPLVRLEITDSVTGKTYVVSTKIAGGK